MSFFRDSIYAVSIVMMAGSFGVGVGVQAETYPNRPASMYVAFPPGGPADALARMLQPAMGDALGVPVVVENHGGAGGAIGVARLLSERPDGHAFLMATVAEPILPPLVLENANYSPEDLRLVTALSDTYLALVGRPDLPFSDYEGLIEWSENENGTPLTYATPGNGTLFHVVGEDFQDLSRIEFIHVPYRGIAPAINDVIGGQVDLAFVPLAGNVISLINDEKLTLIGTTAAGDVKQLNRSPSLRSVPALKDFDHSVWTGIFVDRDVPAPALAEIHKASAAALQSEDFRGHVVESGGVPRDQAQSLEEAEQFYRSQAIRLQEMADQIGLGAS